MFNQTFSSTLCNWSYERSLTPYLLPDGGQRKQELISCICILCQAKPKFILGHRKPFSLDESQS